MDEINYRKKLLMRAEHRGIKEMDIILGRFARDNVFDLNLEMLNKFELFMDQNDQTLFSAILGHEELDPIHYDILMLVKQSIVNG